MSLNKVLLLIDWPSVFCFIVHVISSSALPSLSKIVLSHLHFPYPATLSFIHGATISICLWFWTILSIFKPRSIPFFTTLIPLSIISAVSAILQYQLLFKCSLLHFQISRLLPVTILLSSNITHALPFIIGTSLLLLTHPPEAPLIFIASVVLTVFDRSMRAYPTKLRMKTRATDLQLQLLVRSISTFWLFLAAPFLDSDFSSLKYGTLGKNEGAGGIIGELASHYDIFHLFDQYKIQIGRTLQTIDTQLIIMDEPACFFIYATALLAFFAFVSVRVAHAKLHPYGFRAACVMASAPIFLVHFFIYEAPQMLDGPAVVLVLAGAHHVTLFSCPIDDHDDMFSDSDSSHDGNDDDDDDDYGDVEVGDILNSSMGQQWLVEDCDHTQQQRHRQRNDGGKKEDGDCSSMEGDSSIVVLDEMCSVRPSISNRFLHCRHAAQPDTAQRHSATGGPEFNGTECVSSFMAMPSTT